jgi:hypothetical protein
VGSLARWLSPGEDWPWIYRWQLVAE